MAGVWFSPALPAISDSSPVSVRLVRFWRRCAQVGRDKCCKLVKGESAPPHPDDSEPPPSLTPPQRPPPFIYTSPQCEGNPDFSRAALLRANGIARQESGFWAAKGCFLKWIPL